MAPGTFGTLLALPIYFVAGPRLEPWAYLAMLAGLCLIGVWACELAGRALGSPDDRSMVIDEVAAFLLVLFFTPYDYRWQALAFVLFRFFDIVKPPPIRYYERIFKGGWGAMADDMMAAFYALIALALVRVVVN